MINQRRVAILIDGGSFSATGETTSAFHYYKKAVFLGEECGAGYYGNTSGFMVTATLPASRLQVRVPLVQGEHEVKVPAGTQPGERFKLRGKGMPNVSGRGHGDLHVVVEVATPKKLTKEQRHLLEQLARTMPGWRGMAPPYRYNNMTSMKGVYHGNC